MNWLRDRLETFADRTACIEAEREWTYAEFLQLIDETAAGHRSGERKVIELDCHSTVKGLATLLAIAETRHIALPLPPEIPSAERERMRSVAANSPLYAQLKGSGLVLFSSGTTGQPKGMLHNFEALLHAYQNLKARRDRSLLLLLIDHIGGLDSAFRCLLSGSTLIVPAARTPDAAGLAIARYRVNVLPASPTFLNLMLLSRLHEKYDLNSLEIIAYGAEPMPAPVLQRLAEIFPRAQLQQKFGTSETGAIRIKNAGNNSAFFRIADADARWKIIEDELWLKTPARIIGYISNDNNSLESDGWYRTGDLVECDERGNLRIIGRINETINVGGQKVHPHEVVQVLQSIPDIQAVHVYGEDDPITGSRICAKIISSSSRDPLAWKRIVRSHCRSRLAPWKIPSRIVIGRELNVTDAVKTIDSIKIRWFCVRNEIGRRLLTLDNKV